MESDVNEPVNIGNPHEMSIEDMAQLIIKMTGSTSRIVFKPLPTDDPQVRQPDITRARTLLGWEPKVRSKQGLTSTIDYFRQKMKTGAFYAHGPSAVGHAPHPAIRYSKRRNQRDRRATGRRTRRRAAARRRL